ncbi:hypothetical protein GGR54DRAFT_610874 [Hypoxylon sp. NC1633]|nr:hypothetical protein GGR54DRAFT_610874 [Hypoxylon sp. NC1633]
MNMIATYNNMGLTNRDVDTGESRLPRQRKARSHASRAASPHIQPSHTASYSLNGTSYFPHPCGYHGDVDLDHPNSDNGPRESTTTKSPTGVRGTRDELPISLAMMTPSKEITANINLELKISLAAKHLASQISESKKFWIAFREKFENEVMGIKYYVSSDVLQQIWQKRIEYNGKYKDDEDQDEEDFGIQRMKLEACLDQINEASRAFVRSQPPEDRAGHDARQLALEKIQTAGTLVLRLAARSVSNIAACADLVTEASSLEKLVDPRSSEAKVLHRFNRRRNKRPASSGENADPILTEVEPVLVHGLFNQEAATEADNQGEGSW